MKYQTVGTESGSYGNLTISRGRFGQYKRARVTPLNPRSPAQRKVRETMTSLAESWRGLTDAQMAVWDAFAKDKGMTGTGMQAFMGVNYRTVVGGDAPVLVPPDLAQFGIFSSTGLTATVDAEAGTLTLSVDGAANTKVPDGYLVEATRPVSAGRRNLNSEFRVINESAALANLGGATATIGQAYTGVFGVPGVGKRLGLRVSQLINGQRTPGQVFLARVVAA